MSISCMHAAFINCTSECTLSETKGIVKRINFDLKDMHLTHTQPTHKRQTYCPTIKALQASLLHVHPLLQPLNHCFHVLVVVMQSKQTAKHALSSQKSDAEIKSSNLSSQLNKQLPAIASEQRHSKRCRAAPSISQNSLQLPTSLLSIVISFAADNVSELTGVMAVVNRAWRTAAWHDSAWQYSRYSVQVGFKDITFDGLEMLRRIQFFMLRHVSLKNLIELNHKCPKLTHLCFKYGDNRHQFRPDDNYPKTLPKEQAPVFHHLVSLYLWEAERRIDYKLLAVMFPNVVTLWFEYAPLKEEDYKALGKMQKLKKLEVDVENSYIGLGQLTQLEELIIKICPIMSESRKTHLATALLQMTELRILKLRTSYGASTHMLQRADLSGLTKLETCVLDDSNDEYDDDDLSDSSTESEDDFSQHM